MPKLRLLNIILLLLAVIIIPASCFYYPATIWWAVTAFIVLQLAIVVYGCINISSGYFVAALCKARTEEKVIALSFDDGPHPMYTPAILNTLKKYNAPASFFCIGKNISGNEPILQREKNEGHIVANHSYCHDFWFDMYGNGKMLADMQQADNSIEQAIGVKPLLFRPPYGVTNPNLKNAIKKGKYTTIGWSIRSLDTAIKDKEKLLSRVSDQMKPGDIILLHDSMEHTANILPDLLETIKNKGFRIVGLDKMLNISAYA